jgi:putative ABC transport system permease protein
MSFKKISPPRLAEKLFEWYCSRAAVEDLHGDIDELFYYNLKKMSPLRARMTYFVQVVSLIFSYAIKKRKQQASYHTFSTSSFNPAMLKNYFVIAVRNLSKHKAFTIINVVGLAVGMSLGLLYIAMVSFVYTYDTFHINKDRIYRVISTSHEKTQEREMACTPFALGEKIRDEYPQVEKVVRINRTLSREVIVGEKKIGLNGYFVDPQFFDVFTFPVVKGQVLTSQSKANTIILTETSATKLFGDSDPLGKVVHLDFADFEVSGVLKDPPVNSHMQFDMLAPYQAFTDLKPSNDLLFSGNIDFWNNYVYLLMPENHDAEGLQKYLNSVAAKMNVELQDFSLDLKLQNFNGIAPGPDLSNQMGAEWGTLGFLIFGILTALILLPACFNYASISISRALKRMKEIGLRKVVGGQRNQIFFQFITETVVITLIALLLSSYLFFLARAEFESMIVERLDLRPTGITILYFILFALSVGIAAGFVPAMYFSRLNPVQALKGKATHASSRFTLRRVLIAGQFTLSLGFIMAVVVVLSQYRYIMNFDFGFNQENILDVELQGTDPQIFRNEFGKISSVQKISMSSHVVGTGDLGRAWVMNPDKTDSSETFNIAIDANYLSNLGLRLIAGRNFDNTEVNRTKIIVNESFLKRFQIQNPIDAIDKPFLVGGKEKYIGGVVQDFHYANLHWPIAEFYFSYEPENFQVANLRVHSADMFGDLSTMEELWKKTGNTTKFKADFFNDEIKDTYSFYMTMVKLVGSLGVLAITISCLGLLGMVVFTVENRIKEIGVRKVMGSSVSQIILLLSKDYLKLLGIAALIAIPITYWIMNIYYQESQHYRASIGVMEVVISLLIMLIMGGLTIFSQTVRAARANPVDILRNE